MAKSKKPRKAYTPKEPKDPLANIWDDINGISDATTNTITSVTASIHAACNPTVIAAATPDERKELALGVAKLRNDISTLIDVQTRLSETCKDRRGNSRDPEDHGSAIGMLTEYLELEDRIDTVVMPGLDQLNRVSEKIINRCAGTPDLPVEGIYGADYQPPEVTTDAAPTTSQEP